MPKFIQQLPLNHICKFVVHTIQNDDDLKTGLVLLDFKLNEGEDPEALQSYSVDHSFLENEKAPPQLLNDIKRLQNSLKTNQLVVCMTTQSSGGWSGMMLFNVTPYAYPPSTDVDRSHPDMRRVIHCSVAGHPPKYLYMKESEIRNVLCSPDKDPAYVDGWVSEKAGIRLFSAVDGKFSEYTNPHVGGALRGDIICTQFEGPEKTFTDLSLFTLDAICPFVNGLVNAVDGIRKDLTKNEIEEI